MTKKKCNSFYGMRLINPKEQVIGFVWESDLHEYVLQFYHINKYNTYVCEEYVRVSVNDVCKPKLKEALKHLRRIAKCYNPSYKIHIEEGCYEAIKNECEALKKISEL